MNLFRTVTTVPSGDLDPAAGTTTATTVLRSGNKGVDTLAKGADNVIGGGQTLGLRLAGAVVVIVVLGLLARRGRNAVQTAVALLVMGPAIILLANPQWYVDLWVALSKLMPGA